MWVEECDAYLWATAVVVGGCFDVLMSWDGTKLAWDQQITKLFRWGGFVLYITSGYTVILSVFI
jgi:hypothetical protein